MSFIHYSWFAALSQFMYALRYASSFEKSCVSSRSTLNFGGKCQKIKSGFICIKIFPKPTISRTYQICKICLSSLITEFGQEQIAECGLVNRIVLESQIGVHKALTPTAPFRHIFVKCNRKTTIPQHPSSLCVHLGQVVNGQQVAGLGGQLEIL